MLYSESLAHSKGGCFLTADNRHFVKLICLVVVRMRSKNDNRTLNMDSCEKDMFILFMHLKQKKVASFLWNVMYPKDPCRLYVLPYMNG